MSASLIYRNIFTHSQQEGLPGQCYTRWRVVVTCLLGVLNIGSSPLPFYIVLRSCGGLLDSSWLSEYNPTHLKQPLYFPLNKHVITVWCQATSVNNVITPTAHLVPQGAQRTAKQNAYHFELSQQNGIFLWQYISR